MKFGKFLAGAIVMGLFVPGAFAANLSIFSEVSEFEEGQEFTVDVVLDAKGESINSIEGKVTFPADMVDVVKIDLTGSVMNFWFQEPTSAVLGFKGIEEKFGEITFSGLILGGSSADGTKIFSITFKDKAAGEAMIEFSEPKVLLNDGKGTAAKVILKNYGFSVFAGDVVEDVEEESGVAEGDEVGADEGAGENPTMSYDEEKDAVVKEEIVTKDLKLNASKCEFVVMNGRAAGWVVDLEKVKSDYFKDVNEAGLTWCAPYADYAFENSIVKGRSEGVFGVDGFVSRYEVAVMLARQLTNELKGEEQTLFTDDDDFPYWARGSIVYLNKNGIFKGFTMKDGKVMFGGGKNVVKVDAAIVLYRTFYSSNESDIF